MSNDIEPWDWEPERALVRGLSPRAGALLDYVNASRQRAAVRVRLMATTAMEQSGLDVEELLRRITDNEQLSILFAMTVEAAQRSHIDSKVRALGRALASGALVSDDASLDEAQLVAATLAALEVPHVRAMLVLFEAGTRHGRKTECSAVIQTSLGTTASAAQSIVAVLAHHGLVWVDPPGFPGWGVTDYGEKILGFLDADKA